MADKTAIQWCDSTVNPTSGCDGCELWTDDTKICYAGNLHERMALSNPGYTKDFKVLRIKPGRVAEAARLSDLRGRVRHNGPWKNGLPRMIFVSDMSDALSKDITFEYLLTEVIDVVGSTQGQRHIWQWLSKQPKRMAEFARWLEGMEVPWPENLWVGTSITRTPTLKRIDQLLEVPAAVRFLSVEPQFEDIDLEGRLDGIHWVIQGGGSGNVQIPFHIEWVDRMREQCKDSGVAYFLKQLGKAPFENNVRLKLRHGHGSDWSEWPHERLRVREFPVIGN